MAVNPRDILPTKINLIRLKRDLAMIKRIRRVMEEKREVLLHYIRSTAEEYNRYQIEVYKEVIKIFALYYKGLSSEGLLKVNEYASSTPESFKIKIGTRVLFSIRTNTYTPIEGTIAMPPFPLGVSPYLFESYMKLKDSLPLILKLAMYEETILRLIEELKDTQRLINALDHVILPGYTRSIKYISSVLDERMREDFIRLKMLKRKRIAAEEKEEAVMAQRYRQ